MPPLKMKWFEYSKLPNMFILLSSKAVLYIFLKEFSILRFFKTDRYETKKIKISRV